MELSPKASCTPVSLTLFSPAKVNLFFRVLKKREDNYHEIASLYQMISLGDTLRVCLAQEDKLTCSNPQIPCDERNLVIKALQEFRRQTGYTFKLHIHLEKQIPLEAGLGGGSSNAASALFAFNALSPSAVDEKILACWAALFSSDAPCFFSLGSAFATGRGEQLTDLPALEPLHFWLAKPKEGLSTPYVYAHCTPSLYPERDPHTYLKRAMQGELETFNDLESTVFSLMPTLRELKGQLLTFGFSEVTMTGSGTAFMCFGSPKQQLFLPGVDFFPVHFIQRKQGSWYAFDFPS